MNKVEILVRKNKGNKIKKDILRQFQELNIQLDESCFSSIEYTDHWIAEFRKIEKKHSNTRKDIPEYEINLLSNELKKEFHNSIDNFFFLYIKHSEYTGLIKMKLVDIINNYERIIRDIDKDSICAGNENLTQGIFIDYIEGVNDDRYRVFYCVNVWGN